MIFKAPSRTTFDATDALCINTLRTLAIDAVERAGSGHPGLPLGAAPMAYVLWQRHLRVDPEDPGWPDRDRFVLSAGHGSMLLYSLLHLTGFDLTLEDLKSFRRWGSRTPGHPEAHVTAGVDATTGPLGQGVGAAVGMAMAERALAHRYEQPDPSIVDHFTYALVSDGDLMEGVSSEAASLAGHLRLGKLVLLYDSNHVSLDGPTSLAFTEDTSRRFESYGWTVLRVEHGDTDLEAIDRAITEAKADLSRPTLIVVHTTIGFGAPTKHGSSAAHGSPLGRDEVAATKRALGWDPERSFYVPEDARARFREVMDRGRRAHADWRWRIEAYRDAHPELHAEWRDAMAGELPAGWDDDLPAFGAGKDLATRRAAGEVLNTIATRVPWLLGGDADLSSSTNTSLRGAGTFGGQRGAGRNVHYGVREHAMGAITNGLAGHGGLRPYCATFFCFSDYMRPSVRIAALSQLPVVYVWTHDSIGLGEDGPTHQAVEHLASLRAMPGLWVVRPADANEAAEAWRLALRRSDGPVALVLSRQALPVLDRGQLGPASGLLRGGYVLSDPRAGDAEAIVIATGSEVHVALAAQRLLGRDGTRVRVVSLPCWEVFEAQDRGYRDTVLPPRLEARVSVEAGATFGWCRYTGARGIALGIDRFGASAAGDVNMERFGFTAEHVARAVRSVLGRSGAEP